MRRRAAKPFSEMGEKDQIAEARSALMRLRHPHNRYQPAIYAAIRRWEDFLRSKGVQP